ncbi:MAG: DUF1217 domain-containing protein [Hyphomicrobiales bacterium]|nr:DUF1217 domain-containing protein [Hyphomicrobiales bacterium]
MTALTTFNLFASDPVAARERISKKPNIAREVEYYNENISSIKSIDDFMENQQIYSTVMRSYGLEDMAYAKGFMRKLLEGGIDDDDAMANKLTDPRYKQLVEDFNFVRYGSATTAFDRTQSGVIDNLYSQRLEADAGQQNSGARLAIYFKRKIEDIADAYSIIGDQALLKFVQTAFSLPELMSLASIEKQAEMIDELLDTDDLSDPEFLDNLVIRFLDTWDITNPESVSIPPLISPPGGQIGISQDILSSIQNIKFYNR